MTRQQIDALAAEFHMTERHASPFGSPHYVHDSQGAELELIVAGQHIHASLLFESEYLDHLNRDIGRNRDDWTEESLRQELRRLSAIRKSRKHDATLFAEIEEAA